MNLDKSDVPAVATGGLGACIAWMNETLAFFDTHSTGLGVVVAIAMAITTVYYKHKNYELEKKKYESERKDKRA
jgi:hypothetical protein